jgi:hypothetical protein
MAANVNGLSSGRAVGLAVVRNWMRPLDGEDDDRDEDDESKW